MACRLPGHVETVFFGIWNRTKQQSIGNSYFSSVLFGWLCFLLVGTGNRRAEPPQQGDVSMGSSSRKKSIEIKPTPKTIFILNRQT